MKTKKTDKGVLIKGIKKMGVSLLCMFLGPIIFFIAFSNQEKILYIPLVITATIISGLAIFFAFKGLNIILDSMFKSNKTN